MDKVRPQCGQPSDRGRLKNNRTGVWESIFLSKIWVSKQMERGRHGSIIIMEALRQSLIMMDMQIGYTQHSAAWASCIRQAKRSSSMMNGPAIMDRQHEHASIT